jgi:predicted ATP-dependent serine protease
MPDPEDSAHKPLNPAPPKPPKPLTDFAQTAGGKTFAEILALKFKPRQPLPLLTRNDVFFEGKTHIFAAQPKSGKSTLIRRLTYDWVLLGHRVLILSEEDFETWCEQIRLLQLGSEDNLVVVDAMGRDANDLLTLASKSTADIVVVDTISNLLDIPTLNTSSVAGPPIRKWVIATRRTGKTLILLHHLNDRNEVAGSRSIRSIVDVVITYAESKEDEFLRLVTVKSRMVSANIRFGISKPQGGPVFQVVEHAGEVTLNDSEKQVLVVLDSTMSSTVKDLMQKTRFSEARVRRALLDLAAKKLAKNLTDPKGGRGLEGQWVKVALDEEDDA